MKGIKHKIAKGAIPVDKAEILRKDIFEGIYQGFFIEKYIFVIMPIDFDKFFICKGNKWLHEGKSFKSLCDISLLRVLIIALCLG